jgi:hypothetical protein
MPITLEWQKYIGPLFKPYDILQNNMKITVVLITEVL